MDRAARQKWNTRYRDGQSEPRVARVLQDYQHLLPARGRALDLACGLGGNALLLAAQGLETWAWDISDIAVERLRSLAQQHGLPLQAEARDITAAPPDPQQFDVIVISRFLQRSLAPALLQALRPEGLLFYETFTREAVASYGPQQPAYRLAPQELLTLFAPLELLVYREEGRLGDLSRGFRNEAMFIGRQSPAGH